MTRRASLETVEAIAREIEASGGRRGEFLHNLVAKYRSEGATLCLVRKIAEGKHWTQRG